MIFGHSFRELNTGFPTLHHKIHRLHTSFSYLTLYEHPEERCEVRVPEDPVDNAPNDAAGLAVEDGALEDKKKSVEKVGLNHV